MPSSEDLMNQFAFDIGQPALHAIVFECQLFMIQPE